MYFILFTRRIEINKKMFCQNKIDQAEIPFLCIKKSYELLSICPIVIGNTKILTKIVQKNNTQDVSCCSVSDVCDDFTGIVFDHLLHGPNGCVESGDLSHQGPQLGLVKNARLKTKKSHFSSNFLNHERFSAVDESSESIFMKCFPIEKDGYANKRSQNKVSQEESLQRQINNLILRTKNTTSN